MKSGRRPGSAKEPGPPSPRLRSFQRTGILPAREQLKGRQVPDLARLKQGPAVVIECVEQIPCNPCAGACPRGAVTVAPSLVSLPKVDYAKCNGCALCVARCPGLAIFVVNYNHSATEATVTIPWEMLPRPEKGQRVTALDRAGRPVCRAKVVRVLDSRALDRCAVVTLAVPRRFWNEVRSLRMKGNDR
ncbi:MAG: 4Fe-4S binding protein [bacterium]